MTKRDTLKEAYILVARKKAKDLNTLPADVINLLEVNNGKMTVKGDTGNSPEIEAKKMDHTEKVQAVVEEDFQYKTL